ncbi:sulfatase-like hydrolase/transferase [Roseibium salinum]|uniref:Sulfatase-like hydrolase/transferase n=1 Tax=Roseibium salinum TaxID=1604349 RepID=A0ABT3R7S7_9HYPH|nr:sulfatase-like hydrolase/transferase [Roseibium sp. DSM 29163]MCX2725105.1 sulfatase-like hydrolase/transferase [Roseibium sp. DSM 29163]
MLGTICFLGVLINRYVFLILLLSVMAVDALALLSLFFQMPLPMMFDSLRFAGNLSIADSAVYLAGLLLLLVSLGLTYYVVLATKTKLDRLSFVPFLFVLFTFAAFDWWVNVPPQDALAAQSNFADRFSPVRDAASAHAGLDQHLVSSGERNILIVMVEGLGAFASQDHQKLVWGPLLGEEVKESYDAESGTAVYFGTTTSGEARELCNVMADYRDFRERDSADCLPKRAVEAGYRTAAFHGFTGEFFERFDWYPKIGFQELNFIENNAGLNPVKPLPHCGVAFRGLCDADVAKSVEAFLSGPEEAPKFAYWLTLNSHKPVMPGEVPARLSCDNGGVFDDVELCRMAEQWLNVSHLVKAIALNENLRPTEIVLVGDHHPPLFTRSGRRQFQPGKVAWLHLKPKMDDEARTAAVRSSAQRPEN